MLRITQLGILLAMLAAPVTAAHANDTQPNVSYSAKKQGKVSFSKGKADDATASKDEKILNPADIEPSAGATDHVEPQEKDDLAKKMQLPRK